MDKRIKKALSNFLLGAQFDDEPLELKARVIFINLITPILTLLVVLSMIHSVIIEARVFYEVLFSFSLTCANLISYFIFRYRKDVYRHIRFGSITVLVQVLFVFYYGGVGNSGVFWAFLVPPLFAYVNKPRSATWLITILTFLILLVSFLPHVQELYSAYPMSKFRFAYVLMYTIVLGSMYINKVLYDGIRKQADDLAFTNKRLEQVIKVQKNLSGRIKQKESENSEVLSELKAIINNTEDFVWFLDGAYNLKIYNQSFQEATLLNFGVDLSNFVNQRIRLTGSEEFDRWHDVWVKRFEGLLKSVGKTSFLDKKLADNGKLYYWITDVFPVVTDGLITGIACFTKDITYQKRAQEEKESLTQLNATIVESLGEIIYDYQIDEDRFTWNDAIYTTLGYNYSQMGNGMESFLSKLHLEDRANFEKEFEDLLETGVTSTVDLKVLKSSGEVIWLQNRMNVIINDKGGAIRVIGALININDRKQAEKVKLEAVVKGVDEERKRIASEIHDGLGQTLIAANLIVQSVDCDAQPEYKEKYDSVSNLINQAIVESRTMSHDLMPKSLEEFGLISSVKSLVNKVKSVEHLKFNFHYNVDEFTRFPSVVENNLYRVTQEAFSNIIKHSNATRVEVQLVCHENFMILTIEDNGRGSLELGEKAHQGIGVNNIKNRVASIGGHLEIDSHEGYGTLFTIEVAIT